MDDEEEIEKYRGQLRDLRPFYAGFVQLSVLAE